ncbi:hypothetical protein TNCV_579231 [Trichonephila clavipes]|nr:hypothetical protein TNCV_579231 [Trichonephila clavipes]
MLMMPANENFMDYVVFGDELTFHLSGYVNTYNARIWRLENPHEVLELKRDSPKLNVFVPNLGGKCCDVPPLGSTSLEVSARAGGVELTKGLGSNIILV